MQSQQKFKPRYSFEFFPPKTDEGWKKLQIERDKLAKRKPDFFSVTYGAGGSTRERTIDTVLQLHRQGISTAPHLSCIGSTKAAMNDLLTLYKDEGIQRIVALRGDLPSGMGSSGAFLYASDLVSHIRQHSGQHFLVEVAAYPEFHPQAPSAAKDFEFFKHKVTCGANSAITQYFYNIDAYFNFIDECERHNIDVPIVPGIMPITNYSKLARFSDMCGAEIPRWIRLKLESYGDDSESIVKFGEEVVSSMCERLIQAGAPGLHFYTLNQAAPSLAIWDNLGLKEAIEF